MATPSYTLEFYRDANGDQPVRRWLREELTRVQRQAIGSAMNDYLQHKGVGVCETEFGKHLGAGLFEFRLRIDPNELLRNREDAGPARILLRVFCHAYGNKVVLLLGGYDKGADPGRKRQQAEIRVARTRLKEWKLRLAGSKKA